MEGENVDLGYKQTDNALFARDLLGDFSRRLSGPAESRGEMPLARLYLILANIRKRNDQQCRKPVYGWSDAVTEIENAGNVAVCSVCPTRFLGRDV